jgi:hypothetical protein
LQLHSQEYSAKVHCSVEFCRGCLVVIWQRKTAGYVFLRGNWLRITLHTAQ